MKEKSKRSIAVAVKKEAKRTASGLPPMVWEANEIRKLRGSEFLKMGVKELETNTGLKIPVNIAEEYTAPVPIARPANHEANILQYWSGAITHNGTKVQGFPGVAYYIMTVVPYMMAIGRVIYPEFYGASGFKKDLKELVIYDGTDRAKRAEQFRTRYFAKKKMNGYPVSKSKN